MGVICVLSGLRIRAGIWPPFWGESWRYLAVSHLRRRRMEVNRDCAKEPKRRKSEAEDAQEGHLVGSQNKNTVPDKNTSRKKHSSFSYLFTFMANQTDMPSTPRRKMVCIRQEFERLLRHPCCRNGPEMVPNAAPESSFFGSCCGLLACILDERMRIGAALTMTPLSPKCR